MGFAFCGDLGWVWVVIGEVGFFEKFPYRSRIGCNVTVFEYNFPKLNPACLHTEATKIQVKIQINS